MIRSGASADVREPHYLADSSTAFGLLGTDAPTGVVSSAVVRNMFIKSQDRVIPALDNHDANRKLRCALANPRVFEIMCPYVRPIEHAMREPRTDPQSAVFSGQTVAPELHNAHGVGRLAVICQNERLTREPAKSWLMRLPPQNSV